MAMTDRLNTSRPIREESHRSPLFAAGRVIIAIFSLIFLAGIGMGFYAAHRESGGPLSLSGWIVVAGIILLAAAIATWLTATLRAGRKDVPPRERKSNRFMIGAIAGGAVIGAGLAAGANPANGSQAMDIAFSAPLPVTLAAALAALWVLAMPLLSWWWRRSVDEHERAAYRDGAEIAGHILLIVAPTWWLLSRGGLAPAPDAEMLFVGYSLIWSAVWVIRKYQ